MPEHSTGGNRTPSIWSGTISFGLVSVPVALLPAQRPQRISLRMLAPDGTPLRRRYYCPHDERLLDADEIVRGFEIEKDRFILVEDDELEALAPKKSKEIDLRLFVPVDQIDPSYFDRAYFLSPLGDTVKPYRLLAAAMEASGRAGIATFVMRGKEYLVAILSENGILRAETLRFADEMRSPDDIGLSQPRSTSESLVKKMRDQIRAATSRELDPTELDDESGRALLQLVRQKRESGVGAIHIGEHRDEAAEEEGNVIDLMEILKRSIGLKSPKDNGAPKEKSRRK